ncbi:Putative protein of unknown function [Podospora comata]|uniref:Uncharacterized protein n=1 Tax=Podospora comata TaxID=48703 RepID=A0ABY6S8Q5_PODCO|nr:Putative protein of unknown function [Podospora comata]
MLRATAQVTICNQNDTVTVRYLELHTGT